MASLLLGEPEAALGLHPQLVDQSVLFMRDRQHLRHLRRLEFEVLAGGATLALEVKVAKVAV